MVPMKDGISDLQLESIIMLFCLAVVIVNYFSVNQIAWLLCALWFLSSSLLILIVQPYKKSYMNVLDASSIGVSDTSNIHIPVCPTISKWNTATLNGDHL